SSVRPSRTGCSPSLAPWKASSPLGSDLPRFDRWSGRPPPIWPARYRPGGWTNSSIGWLANAWLIVGGRTRSPLPASISPAEREDCPGRLLGTGPVDRGRHGEARGGWEALWRWTATVTRAPGTREPGTR